MTFRNNALDQQSSQSRLQLEELQFTKLTIDRAADAALWAGSDAHFVYVNEAACRSLEYSRIELLSMMIYDIEPDLPQELWSEHWQTLKEQGSLIIESRYRAKGGRVFPVELSITYVEFQGKEYSCVFARDITNRKQLEADLQEADSAITTARLEEKQATTRQPYAEQSQQVSELPFANTPTLAPRSIFPSDPQLKEVFDFIEANYHQKIGLRDVAQAVGYSSAHLTNLTRHLTGRTVNRWIVERRMVEVRYLLLETSQPVSQIAEAVSYQTEGHFFYQFRQYHGTTPQAWRNTHRIQGSTN